jgi:hypothetical protein
VWQAPNSGLHSRQLRRIDISLLPVIVSFLTCGENCKLFYFRNAEEKNLDQFSKNYRTFTLKIVTQKMGLRSGRQDPRSGKNLFRIPDPGVKKAPDPGSATLCKGNARSCLSKSLRLALLRLSRGSTFTNSSNLERRHSITVPTRRKPGRKSEPSDAVAFICGEGDPGLHIGKKTRKPVTADQIPRVWSSALG